MAVLLIAAETTAEAREILERHGIGVVDGLGNAHIELPGLLLHLEGRGRKRRDTPAPARLSGKAGVIAQAGPPRALVDANGSITGQHLAERLAAA